MYTSYRYIRTYMFTRIRVLNVRLPAWINSWAVYHSYASLQPSHVVATIIIGRRPTIASIYSATHIHIYMCVFVCLCVLCTPHTTTLYYIATVARRYSNCKRSVRYYNTIYNGSGVAALKVGGGGDSDERSALFSLLLFIFFPHLAATISWTWIYSFRRWNR